MNEYLNVIRNNYANFSGRARRREYWMFQLINIIVIVVLEGLLFASGILNNLDNNNLDSNTVPPLAWVAVSLLSVYALAVFVPALAVTVRRLHDAGFSGWMVLLNLIPGVSLVVFVFTILDSKPGANKWGPNPKGVSAPTGAF